MPSLIWRAGFIRLECARSVRLASDRRLQWHVAGMALGMDAGFFEVEISLDPSSRFVGDLALAQKQVDVFAFGRDELEAQCRAEGRVIRAVNGVASVELPACFVAGFECGGHRVRQLI